MIACGLSLPHRSKMRLTGVKYGRKIMNHMNGSGAYKKDMIASGMHTAVMKPEPRALKFR